MPRRVIALALVVATVAAPVVAQEQPAAEGAIYRVEVTGVIELGLAPFIERSLREAEAAGARAVILDIDTPGGRVDAAERIVDAVSDAAVPVYAYVNRRAFSAGAMIALATSQIYMRPGAVIGAATPVGGTGEKAPEKIVSAMRSSMRALAEARGLDPRVAEAMVDEDIAIPGVIDAGKLLTLTSEEAIELGYAVPVDDWEALTRAIGASGAPLHDMEVNWAERLVRFFTHPVVAPFLLSIGFLGLIIEIRMPGVGLPGAVGLLSLGLFFGSHLLIGLAGMEGILLFVAGGVLIAIEVFVVPGIGLLGFLGGAGVLAGLYVSLIGDLPTRADFTRGTGIISTSLLVVLVMGLVPSAPAADEPPAGAVGHLPQPGNDARDGLCVGGSPGRAGRHGRGRAHRPAAIRNGAVRRRAHRRSLGLGMDRGRQRHSDHGVGGLPSRSTPGEGAGRTVICAGSATRLDSPTIQPETAHA